VSAPEVEHPSPAPGLAGRWPLGRWLLLLGLLIAEGLGLGVAFDSETLRGLPHGWWTPLLGLAGSAMPASAALLGALVLVAWGRPIARAGSAPGDSPVRYIPYLALHITGFLVLFALSAALFGRAAASRGDVGWLVAAWLFAVAVTLVAWLGAVLPPSYVLGLVRARAGLLGGALALGLVAFGIGRLTRGLWLPLRQLTFWAGAALLQAVAPGSFVDPATLTFGTDAFAVEIAPQCSGYEGVGLTWAFLLGALWLFRERFRFPRAFLLLAVGTVLPLAANVVRLVALVLIGTHLSPEIAAGGFHSYAGSILFCAIALGTVAGGLRSRWLTRAPHEPAAGEPRAEPSSPAPYLVPFLVMTAAGLVSRAFSTPSSEPLQALRPLAGALALAAFWRKYRLVSWRISGLGVAAGVGVAALWLLLGKLVRAGGPGGQAAVPLPGAGALAVQVVMAVLVAPPVEELAFRGFLARRLAGPGFARLPPSRTPWAGIVVAAVAFGLLHRRPLLGVAAGLCYGVVYRRGGRLADAVVAHAVTNAALLPAAWLSSSWELWR
jgi:exosortase E/protease (VPEID-CTERM system)